MDPVLPAERDATHGILSQVVAQFHFRVLEKVLQPRPKSKHVSHRLAQFAGRQRVLLRGLQFLLDGVEQLRCVLDAQLMTCHKIILPLSRHPVDSE